MSPAVFLDLSIPPEQAELLRWSRLRAFAAVRVPADFMRQDELRDLLNVSLNGRSPVVLFQGTDVAVTFTVSTEGSRDQMRCSSIAYEVATFMGAPDSAIFGNEIGLMDVPGLSDYRAEACPIDLEDIHHI